MCVKVHLMGDVAISACGRVEGLFLRLWPAYFRTRTAGCVLYSTKGDSDPASPAGR